MAPPRDARSGPLRPRFVRLALVAQAGAALFLVALLLLHALTLRSLPWYMSEYANSPYRGVFVAGGYSFALAMLATAIALFRSLPHTRRILTGLVLLAAVVPFAFLATTFRVDPGDRPASLEGQMHDWSTIPLFLFLNAALLLLHPALRMVHSRGLARATLYAGLTAAAAEIAYFLARLADVAVVAVAQRVLVATAIAWCLLVAHALRHGWLGPAGREEDEAREAGPHPANGAEAVGWGEGEPGPAAQPADEEQNPGGPVAPQTTRVY